MPRAPAPVPSEPAVFWVGGSGKGQSYAGPELGSAAPGPTGSFPHRAWLPPGLDLTVPGPARRPKGAARAAREDGARGATAPPALATSQAQRHLSTFQPLPTPPPQDPAFGATRGARTALGPRTVGQNKCHPSLSPLRPGRPHGPRRRRRLAGRRVFRTPGGLVPARPPLPGGASEAGGEAAGKGQSRRQARAENRAGAGGRAGSRPRALPSAARPRSPRRGRPPKRREGGNQDETETRSPPPPPSPP